MKKVLFIISILLIAASLNVTLTFASTAWTDWTSATRYDLSPWSGPGVAIGTLNGISVSYTGDIHYGTKVDGTFQYWLPDTTYIGGSVDSSPNSVKDIIGLAGGNTNINTVDFGSPITNPVFAIWCLGSSGNYGSIEITASFNFINGTPIYQSGGPGIYDWSLPFTGSAITVSGNNVYGADAYGVVQFKGTYNSISWTNPVYEAWYGFTVGADVNPVPIPGAVWLLVSGLIGLIGIGTVRRKKYRQ
jgi:hypothetical protein